MSESIESLAIRMDELRRRLERVERLEPAVMKRDLEDAGKDISTVAQKLEGVDVRMMARDLVWIKRAMFGAVVSGSLAVITTSLILFGSGGHP